MPLQVIQVLNNLRTYIGDAKSERKRIALRNKKFVLGFGEDCDDLLQHLDFTFVTEEPSDPEVSACRCAQLRSFSLKL